MSVNKLQRYGAWFALASTALLLLAIADVVIVALAGGFNNIAIVSVPTPAWVGPPTIAASGMFGLSVLTAFVVAGIYGWAMVFPAIALYMVWSAWLGFRLRRWAPA